jgi:hypothetical protein
MTSRDQGNSHSRADRAPKNHRHGDGTKELTHRRHSEHDEPGLPGKETAEATIITSLLDPLPDSLCRAEEDEASLQQTEEHCQRKQPKPDLPVKWTDPRNTQGEKGQAGQRP